MKLTYRNIGEISEKECEEIDNFIDANNGLIFHETYFNKIVSKYNNTSLIYYILRNINNNIIAICPGHVIKEKKITNILCNPSRYEVPYGGWVFDNSVTNYNHLLSSIKPKAQEGIYLWTNFLVEEINVEKFKHQKFQTSIINLNQSEDEIWNNVIHSKRRNMIRKAQKENIIINLFDENGMNFYYQMMLEMHKKANIKTIHKSFYTEIISHYYKEKKAIIILAQKEEKHVSGIVLIGNKNAFHYWQGASFSEVKNHGQGELLQWEAIKWTKSINSKIYDLCVVEEQRLPNIAKFKLGISKQKVDFYNISKRGFGYRIINRINQYL